jgi:voltage-gated potassium channel Kch
LVVIGYNDTSEMVANLLEAKKIHYVIMEADVKNIKIARGKGYPIIQGDPHKQESLNEANIVHAKAHFE